MSPLGKGHIGLSSFFASAHPADTCGTDGLPLTPNSIKIYGRFQELVQLQHPHLCQYIDIVRGKHERLVIVSEQHEQDLHSVILDAKLNNVFDIQRVAHEMVLALDFLHRKGYVHRNLSPMNILIDDDGAIKLSKYGLYHMTNYNSDVIFPIGDVIYSAPEVILSGPGYTASVGPSPTSADVWSLGMVLLDCFLDGNLWGRNRSSVEKVVNILLSMHDQGNATKPVEEILRVSKAKSKYQEMDKTFYSFLKACLHINPQKRASMHELLSHEFIKSIHDPHKHRFREKQPFPAVHRSSSLKLPNYNKLLNELNSSDEEEDYLAERSIKEVYHFWTLTGGDVFADLKKHGMISPKPPVLMTPSSILNNGEEYGMDKDKILMFDEKTVLVNLNQLRQRLKHIDPNAYYPLVIEDDLHPVDTTEATKLPVVIREKDVEYQFHRIILFERLLEGYPHTRERIVKEARADIPPYVRARVWAVLLNITGDIYDEYNRIDKVSVTPTDRQIEVDIPRCHQYSDLLSSEKAHQTLKNVLKAWVMSHPHLVYWQGLDSLAAPFVSLNFTNEALAYACLSAFIPKYLYNFFLKDNSQVIHEYLAVFTQLTAFHDPELFNHLYDIGFQPELYAIPWFLTMFSHVFPLHKIYLLWDTLLLGSSMLPLCVGVAILLQFREQLLSYGFNECILLFSDMPALDIERCVKDSIRLFNNTPPSAAMRKQDNPMNKTLAPSEDKFMDLPEKDFLPLGQLKSEICLRVSPRDVVRISSLVRDFDSFPMLSRDTSSKSDNKDGRKRNKLDKNKSLDINRILVVDIRNPDEFASGHLPYSVNIPYAQAIDDERKELITSPLTVVLESHRGRMVMVIGNKGPEPIFFGEGLVRANYRRVCVMDGSVSCLRSSGYLNATS